MRQILVILLMLSCTATADWSPIWTSTSPSRTLVAAGGEPVESLAFSITNKVMPKDLFFWEAFNAYAERFYSVYPREGNSVWVHPTNLYWALHWTAYGPGPYVTPTNSIYERQVERVTYSNYKGAQGEAPLQLMKQAVASLLTKYVDVTRIAPYSTIPDWNAYFSTPSYTNPVTGEFYYPSGFPVMYPSTVIEKLGLPNNFFDYTPPRGIYPYDPPITNIPDVIDPVYGIPVAYRIQSGFSAREYGWTNLQRVIKLMSQHVESPLFYIKDVKNIYGYDYLENVQVVTTTISEQRYLNGTLWNSVLDSAPASRRIDCEGDVEEPQFDNRYDQSVWTTTAFGGGSFYQYTNLVRSTRFEFYGILNTSVQTNLTYDIGAGWDPEKIIKQLQGYTNGSSRLRTFASALVVDRSIDDGYGLATINWHGNPTLEWINIGTSYGLCADQVTKETLEAYIWPSQSYTITLGPALIYPDFLYK